MACHHCGNARRAVVKAAKAVVKGDVVEAIDAVKEAAESVKAKLKGGGEGGRG